MGDYEVSGGNAAALFTLKIHRGDGMALLAMNWRTGQPPDNFAGFAIEYTEPGGTTFYPLQNRMTFADASKTDKNRFSTRVSPIQKFRWVHFPRNANLAGPFTYRVTPVFADSEGKLNYGDAQEAAIELRRETYPGVLNVAFTRGFISSQAFVDKYEPFGDVRTLLPAKAADGLTFTPTHPKAAEALPWMGFEARTSILTLLDQAIADPQATVRVVAYDLNEPEVVTRLEHLTTRLRVIVDDSGEHKSAGSAENAAAARLVISAGTANVKRQHMRGLQHNKTIIVDSPSLKTVLCGSTNFSWRGFYVQNNNAVTMTGPDAVTIFGAAFEAYWTKPPSAFGTTSAASWHDLKLQGVDASVAFSPHAASNALLASIGDDIEHHTTSSLLYSLAFLYQTPGPIKNAIKTVTATNGIFVYGMSDRKVGGITLQKPSGNLAPVYPAALGKDVPPPFKSEPTGGGGIRMHHKFVVIDFDKPTARVYLGSYNFSSQADIGNGENLVLIRDRRVAVSYMIQAIAMFDHYHFRVDEAASKKKKKPLQLRKPPKTAKELPWFKQYYTDQQKAADRELFC